MTTVNLQYCKYMYTKFNFTDSQICAFSPEGRGICKVKCNIQFISRVRKIVKYRMFISGWFWRSFNFERYSDWNFKLCKSWLRGFKISFSIHEYSIVHRVDTKSYKNKYLSDTQVQTLITKCNFKQSILIHRTIQINAAKVYIFEFLINISRSTVDRSRPKAAISYRRDDY